MRLPHAVFQRCRCTLRVSLLLGGSLKLLGILQRSPAHRSSPPGPQMPVHCGDPPTIHPEHACFVLGTSLLVISSSHESSISCFSCCLPCGCSQVGEFVLCGIQRSRVWGSYSPRISVFLVPWVSGSLPVAGLSTFLCLRCGLMPTNDADVANKGNVHHCMPTHSFGVLETRAILQSYHFFPLLPTWPLKFQPFNNTCQVLERENGGPLGHF